MPFDYEAYSQKCSTMTVAQLQLEWENYTRQLAGGATSTGCAVLFSPVTAGVSLVGLGISAPRVHNARKKRDIVEKYLVAQGTTHNTRKRDVALPAAISGTLGGLTLGLAGPGADMLGGVAAEKGAEYLISHAALEGAGAALEHGHTNHEKDKAFEKRGKMPLGENGQFQQVDGQQQQYEAVPVPPSYSSSQLSPLPKYQPPQHDPLQSIVSVSSSAIANQQQPPPQEHTFQQPEKVLYVVGNPEAGQPFGLQAQQYPPEKTAAWAPQQDQSPTKYAPTTYLPEKRETPSGSPPRQQVPHPRIEYQTNSSASSPVQTGQQQQSSQTTTQATPPWNYDFNQWAPPPQLVSQNPTADHQSPVAVVESRRQRPMTDQSLIPQPLFSSSPTRSNEGRVTPTSMEAAQDASVPNGESSRPTPTPLQAQIVAEVQPQKIQSPIPLQVTYNQHPPQAQQPQQYIPPPPTSGSPQRYSPPMFNVPPPPPLRTPVLDQQQVYLPPIIQQQQTPHMGSPQEDSVVSAISSTSLQPSQQNIHALPQQQQHPQYQSQTPPTPQKQFQPQTPQHYSPISAPQQQFQPPQTQQPQIQNYQPQPQYQYQPATYVPAASPALQSQNQNHQFFSPPPTSLYPGSMPQSKPARPSTMLSLSSLGSTLATGLQNLAASASRPSSPNPNQQQQQQQQQQQGLAYVPPTPGSWVGPPSAVSPPPGYASPTPGMTGGQSPYAYVSPPPAYASPANGGVLLQGKDYFGQGQLQGQGNPQWQQHQQPQHPGGQVVGQVQGVGQMQVPSMGPVQQYYGAPSAGQWGQ